jgi:hypothetical protein
MSIPHIHVGGPCNPQAILTKISSGLTVNAINPGDLLSIDSSNNVIPASAWPWTTNLATTQAAFALNFRGFTDSRSRVNSADPRDSRVNAIEDGFYDFNVASGTYTVGQYLGINGTSGGMSSQLVGVSSKADAVAIVTRGSDSQTVTTVRGELTNTPTRR